MVVVEVVEEVVVAVVVVAVLIMSYRPFALGGSELQGVHRCAARSSHAAAAAAAAACCIWPCRLSSHPEHSCFIPPQEVRLH